MSVQEEQSIRLPDGRMLSYLTCGDPRGRSVVCMHGFPGSRLDFSGFDRWASGFHLRLIAPDRPGYGGSDPQKDRTLLGYSRDIEALLDALGIETCAVYGISAAGPMPSPARRDCPAGSSAPPAPGGWASSPRRARPTAWGFPTRASSSSPRATPS